MNLALYYPASSRPRSLPYALLLCALSRAFLPYRFARALAVMMFIIFCSYGLGMWYGASEVARDLRNGCTGEHCKTGGDVLTVFWAILNGAMVSQPEAHCECRGASPSFFFFFPFFVCGS